MALSALQHGKADRVTPANRWLSPQVRIFPSFENKILIVPRELTKSDREHRLPLSDFLVALLKKRYIYKKHSEWVFQSSRLKDKHLGGGVGIVRRVRAKSGIHFTFHDLRRNHVYRIITSQFADFVGSMV
jgi:integrase